jgi:DNA gyrase subunit A
MFKKSFLTEYLGAKRNAGIAAIKLKEEDSVASVVFQDDEDIVLITKNGMSIKFETKGIGAVGRNTQGVKGITLSEDDCVVGVCVVDEEKTMLTVTEKGMGKRTLFSDFREMKHRGGKGVTCHNISEKTGKLAAIITVSDDDDIMLITNEGTIIRTSVEGINTYSRTASGVIIMRLSEGSFINNVARLEKAEDIEKVSEEIEKEIENNPIPETKTEEKRETLDSEEESF